jgi:mono/diheme cytochrome c family protein
MFRMIAMIPVVALLGLAGCKANPPSRLERSIVTFAEHRILVGNRGERNPLPATPATIADGKEAFSHYCVACHGMDGQNTGVPFADRMSPPVPSLASKEVQQYTDGQLKWVIDNGIWPSGMPGSKGTLSDDEIWSIVLFLRNLPAQGSQGDPEMYTH